MNESISNANMEQQRLLVECHKLIDDINRKPAATKLLLGLLPLLKMYARYKSNRKRSRRQCGSE